MPSSPPVGVTGFSPFSPSVSFQSWMITTVARPSSGNNNIDLTDSVITIKVGGTEKKVPDSATVAEVTGTNSNTKNFVMETSTSKNAAPARAREYWVVGAAASLACVTAPALVSL